MYVARRVPFYIFLKYRAYRPETRLGLKIICNLQVMKTIIQLAREKGVTVTDIINIVSEWGRTATANQRLNETEEGIISSRLAEVPDPNLQSYFVNIENRFTTCVQGVSYEEYPIINSHFSDDDAQKLCLRLFDKPTVNLAKKFSRDRTDPKIKYSIHTVAENLREFYGGLLLTFVLNLNVLQNAGPTTQIYQSDSNPDYSMRDLVFRNENNDELVITFRRMLALRRPTNFGFAIFKKRADEKRILLYNFSNTGILLESFINRTPPLTLFYRNGGGGMPSFYFGHSTSNCFICGRELDDPHSIIYGIGPTCRSNYPLIFG